MKGSGEPTLQVLIHYSPKDRHPQVSKVRAWARLFFSVTASFLSGEMHKVAELYDTTKKAKGLEDTPCSLWPGLHSELYTELSVKPKSTPRLP